MNRRWICSDVWMDILPSFDRAQLGLKMALISDRFDILVDAHFDGKTELTIWNYIMICKDEGPKANAIRPAESTLSLMIDGKWVEFPLPDRPLPNKIRFRLLHINYIDYSVIEFLRSNKQIWDRNGTKLAWFCKNVEPIWDVLAREILPIFATNIRQLYFPNGNHLDNLLRHISPTLLTDFDQLNSIDSGILCPDGIADDGPNATGGQALSKWLHTPTKNGQPKRFRRKNSLDPQNLEWINNFKETFLSATTSVSYHIHLYIHTTTKMPIEPFEVVNEGTNEKLILWKKFEYNWLLIRCPIGETVTVQWKKDENWDDNLNNVHFHLWDDINTSCIGPLSPPAEEEKEKADE